MPFLPKQSTTRLYLPSTKNSDDKAYVELKTRLTMADMMKQYKDDTELFENIIVDWNFTTENGNTLPVNKDNLSALEDIDYLAIKNWFDENITERLNGLNKEENKDFLSSSTPATLNLPPTI